MCLVIGLKGEPKDVRKQLGSALASRMSLQPIYIDPLSKDEGLGFLKDVLEHAYGQRKRQFLPFTEESAKTLVDLSCPCTPRRLLRICSVVFEEARRQGLAGIDKDFVLKTVLKFGEISISIPLPKKAEPEEKREVIVTRPVLEGVIEYGANGVPHIIADLTKLTAKDVIGLVLYAKEPSSLSLREITDLVTKNWKTVGMRNVSANITQMRRRIIKEGKKGAYRYRLSGFGKSWIENKLVPQLKGEEGEEEIEKRGGARRALFSPKIDELITENYFKLPDRRNVADVMKALREKGLPVTDKKKAILEALKRRLDEPLKGTKEAGEWVFWTE
jgi:hypothetical protein